MDNLEHLKMIYAITCNLRVENKYYKIIGKNLLGDRVEITKEEYKELTKEFKDEIGDPKRNGFSVRIK